MLAIQLISLSEVPISGAGTSIPGPRRMTYSLSTYTQHTNTAHGPRGELVGKAILMHNSNAFISAARFIFGNEFGKEESFYRIY